MCSLKVKLKPSVWEAQGNINESSWNCNQNCSCNCDSSELVKMWEGELSNIKHPMFPAREMGNANSNIGFGKKTCRICDRNMTLYLT